MDNIELSTVKVNLSEISIGALRALMSHAIVNGEYIKLDGSVREFTGSRNLELLQANGVHVEYPKGTGSPNPNCYWDITRRYWRSWSDLENTSINVIEWSRKKSDLFIPKNSQLPKSSKSKPYTAI